MFLIFKHFYWTHHIIRSVVPLRVDFHCLHFGVDNGVDNKFGVDNVDYGVDNVHYGVDNVDYGVDNVDYGVDNVDNYVDNVDFVGSVKHKIITTCHMLNRSQKAQLYLINYNIIKKQFLVV